MNHLSRHFARSVVLAAFSFGAGAVLFGHAQSAEDRLAAERASALRRDGRGPMGGRGDGILTSPDGNFAVLDLGQNNDGSRAHVVYDFAAKKVFLVRFYPNDILVSSKSLE